MASKGINLGNGRPASIELVNEKVKSLRWELRCWCMVLVGVNGVFGFLPHGVSHTARAVAAAIFPL